MGVGIVGEPPPLLTYRRVLLTSGSFTVPDDVRLLVVRCKGGGGGGGTVSNTGYDGSNGGDTTFSSVHATCGFGGVGVSEAPFPTALRPGKLGGPGQGGSGGGAAVSLGGGGMVWAFGTSGSDGYIAGDSIVVTPGQVISYTVGYGGAGATSGGSGIPGGAGGAGYIELEWQV